MKANKTIHIITFILLVVGGLNWLLLGLFQWELGYLFGGASALVSRAIYVLVGLAAVYELLTHKSSCAMCSKEHTPASPAPSQPQM